MTRAVHRDLLAHAAAPWLGALLVGAALPGAWLAPAAFFAAWLAAAWFCLGLVLGALSWLWIHRLTGGRWGEVLRPHVLRLAARTARVLVLFVPLAWGLALLYPWLGTDAGGAVDANHAFIHLWRAPAFLAARCVVYAAVWLLLARRASSLQTRGEAAVALMLHLAVTSLAAVDALAALVPTWSSSGFGLLVIAGQACGGAAVAVALASRTLAAAPSQPVDEGVPLTRDFGNLLLAALLVWAYLSFMQLLVIWAENLPREISWYVPRLQTGWLVAGAALVVLHLALPLALLLFRAVKDSPPRMARLALVLVPAHALDTLWLVVPSVAPHALATWWLAPLLMAGLPLLAFGGPDLGRRPAALGRREHGVADVAA